MNGAMRAGTILERKSQQPLREIMVLFVRVLSLSTGGKSPDDFRLPLFVRRPGKPGQAGNEHKIYRAPASSPTPNYLPRPERLPFAINFCRAHSGRRHNRASVE